MNNHKPRILSGYRVIYKPHHFNHTLNSKNYNGYVYEHRYIMEKHLGRPLAKNEIVHHKDGNKLNNDITNLELTTRKEHAHTHLGYQKKATCIDCQKPLSDSRAKRCVKCDAKYRRVVKNRPSKSKLQELLQHQSFESLAKRFGVSSNAIRKWLR